MSLYLLVKDILCGKIKSEEPESASYSVDFLFDQNHLGITQIDGKNILTVKHSQLNSNGVIYPEVQHKDVFSKRCWEEGVRKIESIFSSSFVLYDFEKALKLMGISIKSEVKCYLEELDKISYIDIDDLDVSTKSEIARLITIIINGGEVFRPLASEAVSDTDIKETSNELANSEDGSQKVDHEVHQEEAESKEVDEVSQGSIEKPIKAEKPLKKKCSRCLKSKILNADNFQRNSESRDGFVAQCKVCISKRRRELKEMKAANK